MYEMKDTCLYLDICIFTDGNKTRYKTLGALVRVLVMMRGHTLIQFKSSSVGIHKTS